jgi:hypothetical protein
MDFDETRLYYSHQQLQHPTTTTTTTTNPLVVNESNDDDAPDGQYDRYDETQALSVPTAAMRRHFREFFRTLCRYLHTGVKVYHIHSSRDISSSYSLSLSISLFLRTTSISFFIQGTIVWVILDTSIANAY